jgi:hypothetical protein
MFRVAPSWLFFVCRRKAIRTLQRPHIGAVSMINHASMARRGKEHG